MNPPSNWTSLSAPRNLPRGYGTGFLPDAEDEFYVQPRRVSDCDPKIVVAVAKVMKNWARTEFFERYFGAVMKKLVSKMSLAGFPAVLQTRMQALYDEGEDCLNVWGSRGFKHPDCAVPVSVRFDLFIYGCRERPGRINAQLRLQDTNHVQRGVLKNLTFSDSVRVLEPTSIGNEEAWEDYVLEGLGEGLEQSIAVLLNRGVVHLEKCTSQ